MRTLILIVTAAGLILSPQQDVAHEELARGLANASIRAEAVSQVVASAPASVPILMSWIRNPPAGILKSQLYIGMADAFGEMRTKEAIPFLIENISLNRYYARPDIWMKTAPTVEDSLPAVAALIKIGPEASSALMRAFGGPLTEDDRLAVMLAVARIGGPQARTFLTRAGAAARLQSFWADEGLKLLGTHP